MANRRDWTTNANEAVNIRLVRNGKQPPSSEPAPFNPLFTYPIFGEEETIFGYQRLKVNLEFIPDTLHPTLKYTSTKTWPEADPQPDDIEGAFKELLPTLNKPESKSDAAFTPPGELLHEYTIEKRKFGIWKANLAKADTKRLLRNMQILVLFFIEGGSYIELDDPDWTVSRWTVFFVYEIKSTSSDLGTTAYSFVGYCTAYTLPFLTTGASSSNGGIKSLTQDNDNSIEKAVPARTRVSQFLILPPSQHAGHGFQLYNTIFTTFYRQPNATEVPVEDPNESFDDLRDIADLIRLRHHSEFHTLAINTSVTLPPRKSEKLPTSSLIDLALVEKLRKATKIAPRQFSRLVEMRLLSSIPIGNRQVSRLTRRDKAGDSNDRAYYFWRLLVKQRLYKHNKESLVQLDIEERLSKLEETLNSVEKDYVRLMDAAERTARKMADLGVSVLEAWGETKKDNVMKKSKTNGKLASGPTTSRKRKATADVGKDDSDSDDVTIVGSEMKVNGSSKRRIVVDDDTD